MKFSAILKGLAIGLVSILVFGCEKVQESQNENHHEISIVLDVDNVTLESASVRVRHDGQADLLWVYLHTEDMETEADVLLSEKIAEELELSEEIVAYVGQNKSVTLTDLSPKTYYRFICGAIDDVSGKLSGTPSELIFRTKRDPALFEINPNWSITRGSRSTGNDMMEYDNFICTSTDDESYVVLPIRKVDFEAKPYYGDVRLLFDDFHADFGLEAGDSQWKKIVKSGDITWSEDRLRSAEWNVYMLGIDTEGELTGLYQQISFTIEQEQPTDAYNRWLGTWKVYKDGAEQFELVIIPSENNLWYYVGGWESNNMFQYDTYDPALMVETFFDKSTGKMAFVSQYLNTLIEGSEGAEEYRDFYFSGSFYYGSNYVIDALNYRMADAQFTETETYSKAEISGNKFSASGMTFPIQEIGYIYYYGENPASISLEIPDLPLTLEKVN